MSDYKMRIAIDFGSTVSALAWNLWERETPNGDFALVENAGWKMQFPTLIAKKSQNPDVPFDKDLFGEDVLDVMRQYPGLKVISEFKHGLYNPSSEEFQTSCRLTAAYLSFLRGFLENNHDLRDEVFSAAEKEIWYTTPLISSYDTNQVMQALLVEAGFTPQNGYGSFKKLDEATSLSGLATSSNNKLLQESLRKTAADNHRRELALFIDIGGLTADINLVSFYWGLNASGEWSIQFQQLGCWPEPSTRKKTAAELCGGLALDQALRGYLEKNHFVNPEVVEEAVKLHGYMDFREFKEQSNDYYWRHGGTRDTLDGLGVDYDRGLLPEADYEKNPEKRLTPERFMTDVANGYINTLTDAIRQVISAGAAHEAAKDLDIREETIDWVFLTGGGSNIFFLRPMLQGKLPQGLPTLNLKKIRESPERILPNAGDEDLLDHTMNCVNGALCYTGDFIAASPADYQIMIRFIAMEGSGQTVLHEETLPLMAKQELLPLERTGAYDYTYHYTSSLSSIRCELVLLQSGEADVAEVGAAIDPTAASKTSLAVQKDNQAKVGKAVVKTAKRVLPAAVFGAAALAVAVINQEAGRELATQARNALLANRYSLEQEIKVKQESLAHAADNITSDGQDTMRVSYRFSVDKERHITCQLSAVSNSFSKGAVPMHLDFI